MDSGEIFYFLKKIKVLFCVKIISYCRLALWGFVKKYGQRGSKWLYPFILGVSETFS